MERFTWQVIGAKENGEPIWGQRPMTEWEMRLFKLHYKGDFTEQWIYLICAQAGHYWDEEDCI